MHLSKTKSLITKLSLILLPFVLFSCRHYGAQGELVSKDGKTVVVPYFDELGFEYHYSAKVVAYDKTLNGILVVKKISESHKRVVLLSDFGNTLFDFEFSNGKSKVIYVMDNLNKKLLVNKLLLYFDFLTKSNYLSSAEYRREGEAIFQSKLKGKRVNISVPKFSPMRLALMSRRRIKAEIVFFAQDKFADSISFESKELPVHMFFKKREKNINADQ